MDFFQEYIVKRKIGFKEWILSALIIIAAIVIIFISLWFMYLMPSLFAVLDAAVIYFAYVLISRFSIEYEYCLTNSDLDIDKIYAKRKRDRILSIDVKTIEVCAPVGTKEVLNLENSKVDALIDCSTKDISSAYYVIYNDDDKRVKFIFNPPLKMVEKMKLYAPSKIYIG